VDYFLLFFIIILDSDINYPIIKEDRNKRFMVDTMENNHKKLLYIEDDPESREMMADILRIHGYSFLSASRGLEGIRLATAEKPDLIIMDINLPDMNGYEVTTLLKSVKSLRHIPIIALSVDAEAQAKERTLAAGCDGFISKPINVSEFIKLLSEYLHGRKELVTLDVEKKILTEYNIRLVEKLRAKIEELEKLNQNLKVINEQFKRSEEQLTAYNTRLFTMNNLANNLRLQESPLQMLTMLPEMLVDGFSVDRAIIFEYCPETEEMKPISSTGYSESRPLPNTFRLEHSFYTDLESESKIMWIKNQSEILNQSLTQIAGILNSNAFIIGCLSGFDERRDSAAKKEPSILYPAAESVKEYTGDFPNKVLIFLDRHSYNQPFATYEVRVLKSFLQTAGIIYENMVLYHRSLKLLHIKEQQAVTDPLTEVYNYRYFQSQIERELLRGSRHHKIFSIAMIDIDNFKQFNDTQGHRHGDQALKIIAQKLKENIRKSDILSRYGGDEFVLILPELSKTQAQVMAQKLVQLIRDTSLPARKETANIKLTISLGIASFPEDGKNEDILLKKADEALYNAKEAGRNQVCMV
jgi:diguanylate cyclase (GGDEF)-like protein